jgi:hypothetical protein
MISEKGKKVTNEEQIGKHNSALSQWKHSICIAPSYEGGKVVGPDNVLDQHI